MKLYLSGPMSRIPAFNIPLFDEYAAKLRSLGHEVVSPAELDDPEFRALCLRCQKGDPDELDRLCGIAGLKNDTWGDLLARDVKLLADGDIEGVVVLPGWTNSRGAILETVVARLCGLPIYSVFLGDLKPVAGVVIESVHASAGGWINGLNVGTKRRADTLGSQTDWRGREVMYRGETGFNKPVPTANDALPPPMRDRAEEFTHEPMEDDEVRVTSKTGGQKGQKQAVLGDICPKALSELAKVAGFGRTKYSRLNYLKGFEYSSAYDACQRHLHEFWSGNETDDESGLYHLAHAAWQCLCLLAFRLRGVGEDDRP